MDCTTPQQSESKTPQEPPLETDGNTEAVGDLREGDDSAQTDDTAATVNAAAQASDKNKEPMPAAPNARKRTRSGASFGGNKKRHPNVVRVPAPANPTPEDIANWPIEWGPKPGQSKFQWKKQAKRLRDEGYVSDPAQVAAWRELRKAEAKIDASNGQGAQDSRKKPGSLAHIIALRLRLSKLVECRHCLECNTVLMPEAPSAENGVSSTDEG